jgi:hypothetical protein
MTSTATSPEFLKRLTNAANRRLSSGEIREQRISFIAGSVDKDSNVTKEKIEEIVENLEGNS